MRKHLSLLLGAIPLVATSCLLLADPPREHPEDRTGWVEIDFGDWIKCALHESGDIACLDDDSLFSADWFYASESGYTALTIDDAEAACGVHSSGRLDCGILATPDYNGPRFSRPGPYAAELDGDPRKGCAVRGDGTLDCWPDEAGDPPGGTFSRVAVNDDYACAVRTDSAVICFEHGDGTGTTDELLAEPTGFFTDVVMVDSHACALASGGNVRCWGSTTLNAPAVSFRSIDVTDNEMIGITTSGTPLALDFLPNFEGAPAVEFIDIATGTLIEGCGIASNTELGCW